MDQIEVQFLAFHATNPQVYDHLVRLARQALARGVATKSQTRVGIGMLWEVLRWNIYLTTEDPTGWKLNNNYRSRYARLILKQEPDLAGVFEIRELRSMKGKPQDEPEEPESLDPDDPDLLVNLLNDLA